jgi:hypothetical protein
MLSMHHPFNSSKPANIDSLAQVTCQTKREKKYKKLKKREQKPGPTRIPEVNTKNNLNSDNIINIVSDYIKNNHNTVIIQVFPNPLSPSYCQSSLNLPQLLITSPEYPPLLS